MGHKEGDSLKDLIKEKALQVGFDLVGIAPAGPLPHEDLYRWWIQKGFHGQMYFLEKGIEKRLDPNRVLTGVKSIISVARNYYPGDFEKKKRAERGRGLVSRYAWGKDYHRILINKLKRLSDSLREISPQGVNLRYYVDTGPVMEKEVAYLAGLGWIGKNGLLINPKLGSYLFLGVILTDLYLEPDLPQQERCGSCTACLDRCPTKAFFLPRILDARRCISYLTIEFREEIGTKFLRQMNRWVFGCDICQEVCPWNRKFARITSEIQFLGSTEDSTPPLNSLLQLRDDFDRKTRGRAIRRAKRRGLVRNAIVAAFNSERKDLLELIEELRRDRDKVVKGQAELILKEIRSQR